MADARVLHRLLLLCILVGVGFAAFAAFEVLDPALQSSCSVSSYFSCQAVDKSGHTTLFGVDDWKIGLGGFLGLLALDVPLLITYDARLLDGVVLLAGAGLALAVVLGSIEVFVIGAFCPVCLGAYISDAGVLAVALTLWRMRRAERPTKAARSPDVDAA